MKRITGAFLVMVAAALLAGCPWDDDDDSTAGDTTVPTAPTALTAQVISSSEIGLAWTAATDAAGVTGYLIERCQGAGCSDYVQIATVSGGATRYDDAGLKGTASYGYRVRATDLAGNLGAYADAAARTADLQPGLKAMISAGESRSYYLDLPSGYDADAPPMPLIIAYHGTGGSYSAWLDYYRLRDEVDDGAILIYPDARPNAAGVKQWDFADDFQMFEDLLDQLPGDITFDADRILVTGHSSGGGFSHELGCRYGDRIRAIAPVAGSLTATSCVGAVAVIQIQGETDSLVPTSIAMLGRRFWVLYNGFDRSMSVPGIESPCVDYALVPADFPVQWCLHQEGDGASAHAWPSFANHAIWAFFQGLSAVPVPHAEAPPNGGNDKPLAGTDTTLTVTLRYPPDMPAAPYKLAAVLGEFGSRQPLTGAPLVFLNLNIAPGAIAGDERIYNIPVTYTGGDVALPGSYTLEIVAYCEGGGFPIPAAGIDHVALVDVDLTDKLTPIVIPGVLDLEVVRDTP